MRHRALRMSEVHVERDGVTIDENRNPAFVPNHFGRRGKRQRRDEDAVTWTQAERVHRQVQSSRAGVQRDRMRRADGRRKCFLELFHAGPGRQPARSQCGDDLLNFGFTYVRTVEWDFSLHRNSLFACQMVTVRSDSLAVRLACSIGETSRTVLVRPLCAAINPNNTHVNFTVSGLADSPPTSQVRMSTPQSAL